MEIKAVGIDLAKSVFQVHCVDKRGKVLLRKQRRRAQVMSFFARLVPCVVGMEACSSAHHWARKLQALGHTVRLIAPQFVKPYVKSNKNDVADAEAICEALQRPGMRFVAVKTVEQQATDYTWQSRGVHVRPEADAAVVNDFAMTNRVTLSVAILTNGRFLPKCSQQQRCKQAQDGCIDTI